MEGLLPPKTPRPFRIIDVLMIPIMFVLGGFKRDSIQETHPWHCYRKFNPKDIDTNISVYVKGEEKTFRNHLLFLFHAPILGGWKNYCVLSPAETNEKYYIGWIVKDENDSMLDYGINKLVLSAEPVRLLEGPQQHQTHFFAVGSQGQQIPLKQIGRGRLGDGKHPNLRLL